MASENSKKSAETAKDSTDSYNSETIKSAVASIAKLTVEINAINPVIGTLKGSLEAVKPYLQQSADFEFSIQELKNVLTTDRRLDFAKLETKILKLSGESSISNTEFATIIKEGAFNGLSGDNATTESVADFADTGGKIITGLGLDPETTAQLLAKIRFEKEFDEKNILNFLIALQNKIGLKAIAPITSKILLESENIKQISAKETVALSTVFGDKDDSATQTIESIKIFLNSIDPEGGKISQKDIFAKLNSLEGLKGENLKAVVKAMLSDVKDGDQKNKAIEDIVKAVDKRKELEKAFKVTENENSGAFNKKVSSNSNLQKNQLKNAENQLGNLDLSIGNKLWPDVTKAMDLLGTAINDLTSIINEMSSEAFLGVTAAGSAIGFGAKKVLDKTKAEKKETSERSSKSKKERELKANKQIAQETGNKVKTKTKDKFIGKMLEKTVLSRLLAIPFLFELGPLLTLFELGKLAIPEAETLEEDLKEKRAAFEKEKSEKNYEELRSVIEKIQNLQKTSGGSLEETTALPSGSEHAAVAQRNNEIEEGIEIAKKALEDAKTEFISFFKKHIGRPQTQYINSDINNK